MSRRTVNAPPRRGRGQQVVYDRDSGQLPTGTLMDYSIPRPDTLPRVTVDSARSRARRIPLAPKVWAKASPSLRRRR